MQKVEPQLFFIEPMQCKPVRRVEDLDRGKDWQFEVKFDGYRCEAIKQNNDVQLFSRNGQPFPQFTNLFEPLRKQHLKRFIVDGEIVALDADGRTNFNALQRAKSRPIDAHLYLFDILHVDGKRLTGEPLAKRQQILQQQFDFGPFIHFAPPLNAPLNAVAAKIQQFGFEGVIAKRKASLYVAGKADGNWLKKKLKATDEFIIGGYILGRNGVEEIAVGKSRGGRNCTLSLRWTMGSSHCPADECLIPSRSSSQTAVPSSTCLKSEARIGWTRKR